MTFNDGMLRSFQCRMQVQGKDTLLATRYSSPLDCAMKTLESEGVSLTSLLHSFINAGSKRKPTLIGPVLLRPLLLVPN